jgi:hypothetical protein
VCTWENRRHRNPRDVEKTLTLEILSSLPYFKNLKEMRVGFDPLMCARVTIPFNIVSLE